MTGTNIARDLEKEQVKGIMGTREGRHFMWRLLEQSGTFADCFDVDPYIHANNAGRRSLGVWLDSEIRDAAPGSYETMIKEHIDG